MWRKYNGESGWRHLAAASGGNNGSNCIEKYLSINMASRRKGSGNGVSIGIGQHQRNGGKHGIEKRNVINGSSSNSAAAWQGKINKRI